MGSKLEYWFLHNSCCGFGRDDFEDGVGVVVQVLHVVVDVWHISGGIVFLPTFSNTSIFQSPISSRVWILDFPIYRKSLPIAQNSSNRQSFI